MGISHTSFISWFSTVNLLRYLRNILEDSNSAVVWMVSILPLIASFPGLFSRSLGVVLRAPNQNWYHCHLHPTQCHLYHRVTFIWYSSIYHQFLIIIIIIIIASIVVIFVVLLNGERKKLDPVKKTIDEVKQQSVTMTTSFHPFPIIHYSLDHLLISLLIKQKNHVLKMCFHRPLFVPIN